VCLVAAGPYPLGELGAADCFHRHHRPGAQTTLGEPCFLDRLRVAHEADEFAGGAVIGFDGVFANHEGCVFQRFHPPAERLDGRLQLICNHGVHLRDFASRMLSRSQRLTSFPVAIRHG
jgi:hypothetical protein